MGMRGGRFLARRFGAAGREVCTHPPGAMPPVGAPASAAGVSVRL